MTLILFDGNSLVHRAFHSAGNKPNAARPVGKFVGFLWGILNETLPFNGFHPTHAAAIFDPLGPNWRSEIFPEYKIHRVRNPGLMAQHFVDCREACRMFGLPTLTVDGYEADDLIATYTRMAMPRQQTVVIVSQDKDLMQLIRENVFMLDHRTSKIIREGDVHRKFGVFPDRVQDFLALAGDAADGVPGAPGIGLSGAADLLREFKSVHRLLAAPDMVRKRCYRESLTRFADNIRLAYRLVELRDCRPKIPATLDDMAWLGIDMGGLLKLLYRHDLRALAERLCHATGRDAA